MQVEYRNGGQAPGLSDSRRSWSAFQQRCDTECPWRGLADMRDSHDPGVPILYRDVFPAVSLGRLGRAKASEILNQLGHLNRSLGVADGNVDSRQEPDGVGGPDSPETAHSGEPHPAARFLRAAP
jgi:hypothetical protein